MTDWRQVDKDKGEKLARDMSDFVNAVGSLRTREFCFAMSREHRTLQQNFSKLCYEWLRFQSQQYEDQNYDGRNEYACRVANKIMTDPDLKYETQLPLI